MRTFTILSEVTCENGFQVWTLTILFSKTNCLLFFFFLSIFYFVIICFYTYACVKIYFKQFWSRWHDILITHFFRWHITCFTPNIERISYSCVRDTLTPLICELRKKITNAHAARNAHTLLAHETIRYESWFLWTDYTRTLDIYCVYNTVKYMCFMVIERLS